MLTPFINSIMLTLNTFAFDRQNLRPVNGMLVKPKAAICRTSGIAKHSGHDRLRDTGHMICLEVISLAKAKYY